MIKKVLILSSIFLSISFFKTFGEEVKAKPEQKSFVMDLVEIKGKIDKPQIVYVINLLIPPLANISLERSFIDDIKHEKIDKLLTFDVDKKLKHKLK